MRSGPGFETGPIIPHPTNADIVFGSCKGQFSPHEHETGEEQHTGWGESLYGTVAYAHLRFQRVSPFEVSPFPPHAIYYGVAYVHKTLDKGQRGRRSRPISRRTLL